MALSEAQREAAATALVDRYAPDAPADVRTAAVSLVVKSLKTPAHVAAVRFEDQGIDYQTGFDLMRRCGATSILAAWRRPRARALK